MDQDNIIIYGGLTNQNVLLDELIILELTKDKSFGKKLELKDICGGCQDEILNPINVFLIMKDGDFQIANESR